MGAWARSVPETGGAIYARITKRTETGTAPNQALHLTAYSVRSAPAFGSR
jgi:hypothetical protein